MQIGKLWLQLFADGDGASMAAPTGGDTATADTGVQTADAGQTGTSMEDRLRTLGVPEERIQRRAKAVSDKQPPASARPQARTQVQAAPTSEEAPTAQRRTLKEILKSDESLNAEAQQMIQSRLRSAKGAEERLGKLQPLLDSVAAKYGIDISSGDYTALIDAVNKDESYYERLADEQGVSAETARKLNQLEISQRREQARAKEAEREAQLQEHFFSMQKQAQDLSTKLGRNVSLDNLLQDQNFLRMTAPGSGLSVEQAYYALHHDEELKTQAEAIAQGSTQRVAASVQANRARPTENGHRQASSTSVTDYRQLTRAQQRQVVNEMRRRSAAGERVTISDIIGKK